MSSIIHVVAFFALLLTFLGCGGNIDKPKSEKTTAQTKQTSDSPDQGKNEAEAKSKRFRSDAHGFLIAFPGEPQKEKELTGEWSYNTAFDGVFYVVQVEDLTDDQLAAGADAILDEADDGYVEEFVKSREKISLGEYPGVELRVESPPEEFGRASRAQIFLVGNRVYLVAISGPLEKREATDNDAFFESFEPITD